ncbi:hypothetical protein ACOSQ3_013038 [Xanthoceras sorbifolium]
MDSLRTREEPVTLSYCNSARKRCSSDSNSPEFEFWMVRNPSFPQPNLLSADELFVDGVLLPLHLLCHKTPSDHPPDPNPDPENPRTEQPEPEPEPEAPELAHATTTESVNGLTSSKRWTDIFKKGDKKAAAAKIAEEKDKEKEKRREKKSQSVASSAAELNINIWPFSRSRSAGNGGTRPRLASGAPGTRKVSSAPCSRSNSAGESKSRKWPSSPGRPGVHLGRSSPIWQVKRGGEKGIGSKREVTETRGGKSCSNNKSVSNGATGTGGGKVKVLNLNVNVPMCIGYRHHLGCRSDENSALGVVGVGSNKSGNGTGNGNTNVTSSGNLFNLRSLFTKKVY